MKEEILRLRGEGKTYKEIQKLTGASKGTISYHCGAGQKEKTVARTNAGRHKIRKYIQEYKQGKTCQDCGEDYPYWILEFDHLDGKLFTIGMYRQYTVSLEVVKKEIEKCDVVCSNCHKNRTYQRALTKGESALNVEEFYN